MLQSCARKNTYSFTDPDNDRLALNQSKAHNLYCMETCTPEMLSYLAPRLLSRCGGLFVGFHRDCAQDVGEGTLTLGARNLLTIDSVRSRILDFTGGGPNGPQDTRQACAIHRAASLLINEALFSWGNSTKAPRLDACCWPAITPNTANGVKQRHCDSL